jgi:hypothetical protein
VKNSRKCVMFFFFLSVEEGQLSVEREGEEKWTVEREFHVFQTSIATASDSDFQLAFGQRHCVDLLYGEWPPVFLFPLFSTFGSSTLSLAHSIQLLNETSLPSRQIL